MNLGFYSPFHPIPGISSGQYDLSYEQHFRGTDMSFKLTPFYTWVSNWQQQTFIGSGFVTQVPVGVNRNQGVEFQFNKGDFTRNGLSGQLAFTYTNSKVMFQNIPTSHGRHHYQRARGPQSGHRSVQLADQGRRRHPVLPRHNGVA